MLSAGSLRLALPIGLVTLVAASLAAQQPAAPAPAPAASSAPGIRLSGYMQARETWQEEVGLVGTINRARLAAAGRIGDGFSWRILGEYRTGNVGNGKASVALQDAYIRWIRNEFGVQAGQFKTPFSREFVTTLPDLETADRAAVVDALAPKRDIGIMVDYDFRKRVQLFGGVFNGDGQNTTGSKDSTALGVARAVIRPHREIALGVHGARWFGDSTRYGADVNYEGSRIILRGEVAAQSRDSAGGKHDRGWFVLGAYKVIDQVQLAAKYEEFERPSLGSAQDDRAWTGAAHVFLHRTAVRLTLEYISRTIGDPGVRKGMVLTQAQVRF